MDCPACGITTRPGSLYCHTCGAPLSTVANWPEKPWLHIWIRPRATIRAIVDSDPEKHVLLLAVLFGIARYLDNLRQMIVGESPPVLPIIAITLFGGAAGGLVFLWLGGALIRRMGGRLGGQASSKEVRTAITWSLIPAAYAIALWISRTALFGGGMFTFVTYRSQDNFPWGFLLVSFVSLVVAIWAFVVLIFSLSVVHRFSVGRAIASLVIPAAVTSALFLGFFLMAQVIS